MLKRGLPFAGLVLAFVCLACQTFAATPNDPLPNRIAGHISVRSVDATMKNVFKLVDRSTKGTKNHVPSEILSMLAQIYLPLPLDAWKSGEPTHLVFVDYAGTGHSPVVIFEVDSFEQSISRLENHGWEFGENADSDEGGEKGGAEFAAVLPVVMPDGKSMIMADLGEGRAAMGERVQSIVTAARNRAWTPVHFSTADIAVNISTRRYDTPLEELFAEALDYELRIVVMSLRDMGISTEAAEGIMLLAGKYFPRLGAELDKATNILVEVTFGEDRLIVDVGGSFADGGLAKEIIENAAPLDSPPSALAAMVPGIPLSVAVTRSFTSFMPEANQIIGDAFDSVADAFPTHGSEIGNLYRIIANEEGDANVSVMYSGQDASYQYSIFAMQDADAAFEGMVAGVTAAGRILGSLFDNPDERVELVSESHSRDGFSWVTFKPVAADKEKFEQLIKRLNRLKNSFDLSVRFNADMRIHLARLKDANAVVMATGMLDEDEFFEMLQDGGKRANWFDAPGAQDTLAALQGSQIAQSLVDADQLFYYFAVQSLFDDAGMDPEAVDMRALGVLRRMAAGQEKRDADIGIGLGSVDGWLRLRCIVPIRAVTAVVRNFEKYQEMLRSERRKPQPAPEPEEADDGDVEEAVDAA